MTESGPVPIKLSPAAGGPQQAYRAVSKLAVAAMVVGLLAPMALIAPILWAVPVLGIAMAIVALKRLSDSSSELVGRTAALAGLALSITLLVVAPVRQASAHWSLHREARTWGLLWFELLANDEPHKAHQLTLGIGMRQSFDAHLWDAYRHDTNLKASLEDFVDEPLVRVLLALGPKVEVHFWGNVAQQVSGRAAQMVQDYSVSYGTGDERATFFCRLMFVRLTDRDGGPAGWQIKGPQGGVLPLSMSK